MMRCTHCNGTVVKGWEGWACVMCGREPGSQPVMGTKKQRLHHRDLTEAEKAVALAAFPKHYAAIGRKREAAAATAKETKLPVDAIYAAIPNSLLRQCPFCGGARRLVGNRMQCPTCLSARNHQQWTRSMQLVHRETTVSQRHDLVLP